MRFTAEFSPAGEGEWRALVEGVLKGKEFAKALVSHTRDGIAIMPLDTRRKDAPTIAGARGVDRWRIAARLDDPDPERGNRQVHDDLLGGADTLTLTFAGSPQARGFGLRDHSPSVLDHALADVHCDLVAMRLETAPFAGRANAEAIVTLAKRRRIPGSNLRVDFGLQPIADLASTGRAPLTFSQAMANVKAIIVHLRDEGFSGPFLRCDGRPFHEAGASEAQELACVIAQGVSYVRALVELGQGVEDATRHLDFTLVADVDQFLTIAKFRALRLLWARIEEEFGTSPRPVMIHAETAWRMLTRHDPHVNILRSTIAALAAGIGGADSLEVLPFTVTLGLPDGPARRIARNTSLVLLEEANLHRVMDSAAGSGSIESLTDHLCETAWRLFQTIEASRETNEAGLPAALTNGFVAGMIRETREARARSIATRREPITGASEFPLADEYPVRVLAMARSATRIGEHALPSIRLSEPYEALRDRAEALADAGHAPAVYLANLGRVSDFNARATFARSAFEAGGIRAIANDGFVGDGETDLDALRKAFSESGAFCACICSSDSLYAALAVPAARALKAAGARHVWIAGRVGEQEREFRAAGIEGFVAAGCDMLEFLDAVLEQCEAKR